MSMIIPPSKNFQYKEQKNSRPPERPDPGGDGGDFFWESTLKDVQRSNIIGKPFKAVTNCEFLLWAHIYAFRPLLATSKI